MVMSILWSSLARVTKSFAVKHSGVRQRAVNLISETLLLNRCLRLSDDESGQSAAMLLSKLRTHIWTCNMFRYLTSFIGRHKTRNPIHQTARLHGGQTIDWICLLLPYRARYRRYVPVPSATRTRTTIHWNRARGVIQVVLGVGSE